jgi:hypothetical protein
MHSSATPTGVTVRTVTEIIRPLVFPTCKYKTKIFLIGGGGGGMHPPSQRPPNCPYPPGNKGHLIAFLRLLISIPILIAFVDFNFAFNVYLNKSYHMYIPFYYFILIKFYIWTLKLHILAQ